MLSIVCRVREVLNRSVRRKTLVWRGLSGVGEPSGPMKTTVGCVILSDPRRKIVAQAVNADVSIAKAEINTGSQSCIVTLALLCVNQLLSQAVRV